MVQLIPIDIKPGVGIDRDGTQYSSQMFIDGSWMRTYREYAQKIGGCMTINNGNGTIIRNLYSINVQDAVIVYIGRPNGLWYIKINQDLSTSGEINVTPADFVANDNITWSISGVSYNNIDYILAIPLLNASDISNITPGKLYSGIVGTTGPLTAVAGAPQVTGGVVTIGNYITLFGSNGLIYWNDGSVISNWPGANFISFQATQFVFGSPVRGNALSGVYWGLSFVAQITLNTDTTPKFVSSYVSTESTLLSSRSIISLDPYFYWPGNNSFYMFNGAVVNLKNNTNKKWFFRNLNRTQAQKVTGFVNRIYNEIWWLAPFGTATENTNAIFMNADTQDWSDTDQMERTCGIPSSTQLPYPLMCSSQPIANGQSNIFPLWVHEYGVDKIQLGQKIAITSFFTTNYISMKDIDPSMKVGIIDTVIPDIQQTGNMTVNINSLGYPRSIPDVSEAFMITPETEFLTVRQKSSIFSATFTSNEAGGDYLMGRTSFLIEKAGDQRMGPSII
jgi:hypothetical protein